MSMENEPDKENAMTKTLHNVAALTNDGRSTSTQAWDTTIHEAAARAIAWIDEEASADERYVVVVIAARRTPWSSESRLFTEADFGALRALAAGEPS